MIRLGKKKLERWARIVGPEEDDRWAEWAHVEYIMGIYTISKKPTLIH